MKTIEYTFRILVNNEDAPNPVHLCEELDYYLTEHTNTKLLGYTVKNDNLIQYNKEEE